MVLFEVRENGNGFVLVEHRRTPAGGTRPTELRRYGDRAEAEADCARAAASRRRYLGEVERERRAQSGGPAASEAEEIDGRRTRVRGGW